jgi:YD repeat-containing protein
MKTFDFNPTLTSAKLNEQFEKNFGGRVNLGKFSREQLEDMRNKVRTMVFQQESSAGYNDLLTNETYQKNQAMLQLLNTRIKEMLGEDIKKLRDKMDQLSEAKKVDRTGDGKKDFDDIQVARMTAGGVPKKKAIAKATSDNVKEETKAGEKTKSSTGGTTQVQYDKDGKRTGVKHTAGKNYGAMKQPFDKNSKDLDEGKSCSEGHTKMTKGCTECAGMWESTGDYSAKKGAAGKDLGKPGKNFKKIEKSAGGGEKGKKIAGAVLKNLRAKESMSESNANFKHNVKFVNESLQFLLNEDEEGKAKAITAASDIVNDFTSWMQRVGQYQTKSMIELADSIKANFGAAEAETFKTAVAASLSQTLEVLTSQREAISGAVAVLAGEATPEAPMGQEPDMGMDSEMPPEDGMDMSEPDDMNPEPAGDEFAGAEGPSSNREVRESREQTRARKLAESHSIMSKLAR